MPVLRGLRQRHVLISSGGDNGDDNDDDDGTDANRKIDDDVDIDRNLEVDPSVTKTGSKRRRQARKSSLRLIRMVYGNATVFLHLTALLLIVYGLLLRRGFHNGDECDMTYSMRNYVPIPVKARISSSSTYKLYKFVDGRDPRHEHLLTRNMSQKKQHCAKNPFVVVFIPGHWGSYTQCRSLGAHGIKLTKQNDGPGTGRTLMMLQDGTLWNGMSDNEEGFIYEVYCVDFAEQGAAMHGNLIRTQSQYVADVVQQLSEDCSVSKVTLVGHSIGGIVAKAMYVYVPSIADKIHNIITLATPHVVSPYSFDASIWEVYRDLELLDRNVLVISIAGGLKDELIPAHVCEASSGVSRLAGNSFGMDHKAIVWCHQVLEKVRKILFTLSKDESPDRKAAVERVGIVNGKYTQFVTGQRERYIHQHGYVSFVALESAMVYNVDLLLVMYSLMCGVHLMLPKLGPLFAVFCTTGLSALLSNHQQSIPTIVVLSLLLSSVLWGICRVLSLVPVGFAKSDLIIRSSAVSALTSITILSILVGVIVVLLGLAINKTPHIQASHILFLSLVLWLSFAPLNRTNTFDPRSIVFSAFSLVSLPVLLSGKLLVIGWSFVDDFGDLEVISFVLKCMLPITFRFMFGKTARARNHEQPMFVVAHVLNIMAFAPGMFQVGSAHIVSYYLSWVSVIEVARIFSE